MGRLTKAKVGEIQRLYVEGYTKKEIAERVGVSRGTVAKYVGKVPGRGEGVGEASALKLLQEVVKTLYDLLAALNVTSLMGVGNVANEADEVALRLTERIAQISPSTPSTSSKTTRTSTT